MRAVAVRGFDDQQVGFLDARRIAHDRPARLPQVAAERHFDRAIAFADPDLDDRGTEVVAGVAEATVHGTVRDEIAFIVHGLYLRQAGRHRSEEHTSELQSLMRISYAVFCLKKKKYKINK